MSDFSSNNGHSTCSSPIEPTSINAAKPLIELDNQDEGGIHAFGAGAASDIEPAFGATLDSPFSFSANKRLSPPPSREPNSASGHRLPEDHVEDDNADGTTNLDSPPPIPIPVPRSQTPQLAAETSSPTPSDHTQSQSSSTRPLQDDTKTDRFSYGYGYSPTSPSSLETTSPRSTKSTSMTRTNVSGLARTIRASITNRTNSQPNRRFAAPLPFTRLEEGSARAAPAVVDLGTAGRGFESSRVDEAIQGVGNGDALWSRWDAAIIFSGATRRKLRLLLVAYRSALKIWDTTDVGSLSEVLHLPLASLGSGIGNERLGRLAHAAVLPRRLHPRQTRHPGESAEVRDQPLIGLAFDTGVFLVYSLKTHHVVHRFHVGQGGKESSKIMDFEVNEDYLVISMVSPPSLHILSSNDFRTLVFIPESKLMTYLPPQTIMAPTSASDAAGVVSSASASAAAMLSSAFAGALTSLGPTNSSANTAHPRLSPSSRQYPDDASSPPNLGSDLYFKHNNANTRFDHQDTLYNSSATIKVNDNSNNPHTTSISQGHNNVSLQQQLENAEPLRVARPVYALSHRLLAYATPGPSHSRGGTPSGYNSRTSIDMPTSARTELLRVGGSVWGGVQALGGLAVSAARSRMGTGTVGGKETRPEMGGGGSGGGRGIGRFFSRSAPERREHDGDVGGGDGESREREAEEAERRERRYSGTSSATSVSPGTMGFSRAAETAERACHVTVVDLRSLLLEKHASPETVLNFSLEGDKLVSLLEFAPDGCALGVVPRDGQSVQVVQLRPTPKVPDGKTSSTGSTWHIYNLRRGRTNAVVDSLQWTEDGRWLAIGTKKRTVHVFAVNPYGGKSDSRSHLEGRVRNVDELHPMPTEMYPIVRLRAALTPSSDQNRKPVAFTFVTSSDDTLPVHLLPLPSQAYRSRSRDARASSPISPSRAARRPTNFQDIILFDPLDHSLVLKRLTLDLRPKEQGIGLVGSAAAAIGATSISLPRMGGISRISDSPSSGSGGAAAVSPRQGPPNMHRQSVSRPAELPMELNARDSTVVTWSLANRGQDTQVALGDDGGYRIAEGEANRDQADWLSHAELSTFSKSTRILPRSIYLTHQFSFHTLGEDYHALIRRYQLDIGGLKIDARREVQVSAYPTGGGESFIEGFSPTRDSRNRNISSSFDEPLASALSNELDHTHAPGVLPMFPNGLPSSRPQHFRNAIPIRTIGDGMSESLSRIRREINKVRSPRLRPRPDSTLSMSVPLEFDEEDEDFLLQGELDVPTSRDTSSGGRDSEVTVPTPATSAYTLDDGEGGLEKVEDGWGGWSSEDKLAVEEVERFDTFDVLGLLDEEQESAKPVVKRKGRSKRRS